MTVNQMTISKSAKQFVSETTSNPNKW